jgi:uncharacterized protein YyaL (SSP411 family)
VAAFALQRLSYLCGRHTYARAAERCLTRFDHVLREAPHAAATLLGALRDHLEPPRLVVLRGPAPQRAAWQRALATRFLPQAMVFAAGEQETEVPVALSQPSGQGVTAYVCDGRACRAPIGELSELLAALGCANGH